MYDLLVLPSMQIVEYLFMDFLILFLNIIFYVNIYPNQSVVSQPRDIFIGKLYCLNNKFHTEN